MITHSHTCFIMTESAAENDLELIEVAIRRILRENPHDPLGDDSNSRLIQDEKDKQLLLRLLGQLNSLRAARDQKVLSPITENSESSGLTGSHDKVNEREDILQTAGTNDSGKKICNEEIIREIRNVKKQNKITHVLLGIMFVSSALWRLSELSVILNLKNTIIHPVKAVGGIILGKSRGTTTQNRGHHHLSAESPRLPHMEASHLHHIEIPSVNPILNSRQHLESSARQAGPH